MESLYWVITLKCNDFCDHCYNNSGPKGESIDLQELLKVVPNLPSQLGRIILSGGEPTAEMDKLLNVVKALKNRYADKVPIFLQSNGDLLDARKLKLLLAAGIDRIDITSLDRFHKHQGSRMDQLRELFLAENMIDDNNPVLGHEEKKHKKIFAFWGANEDIWLKGNWARGRALDNNLSLKNPDHNFCELWSGAKGFLDDQSEQQEVHIQLYRVYPCCPTTLYSMGDARNESVTDILNRHKQEETFQVLNRGDVYTLGTEKGLSREFIKKRIAELGDVCLWCDEYFDKYYDGEKGERRMALPGKK